MLPGGTEIRMKKQHKCMKMVENVAIGTEVRT